MPELASQIRTSPSLEQEFHQGQTAGEKGHLQGGKRAHGIGIRAGVQQATSTGQSAEQCGEVQRSIAVLSIDWPPPKRRRPPWPLKAYLTSLRSQTRSLNGPARPSSSQVIQTSALIRTRRSGRLTAGREAFLP
jgi:hypothetical protein